MKKFLVTFLIFSFCFPVMAFAFTVPEEVQVVPQQSYSPSTGIDQRVLTNLVKSSSMRVKALEKKVEINAAATSAHTGAVINLSENVDGLVKAVDKSVDEQRATGRKVEGVEKTLKTEGISTREHVYKNAQAVGWGLAALIIVAVLVILARTKGQVREVVEPAMNTWREQAEKLPEEMKEVMKPVAENTAATLAAVGTAKDEILAAIQSSKEEIIEVVPAKTAGINELQRSFVLKGIHGKDYCINPIMVDGKVRTLKLVKDFDEDDYDNPSEYPRTPAKSPTHLKATNAKMLMIYFDPTLKCSDLQESVIKNAISIGEVEEVV